MKTKHILCTFLCLLLLGAASPSFAREERCFAFSLSNKGRHPMVEQKMGGVVATWRAYADSHSDWDIERLLLALVLAEEKYKEIVGKGDENTPYMVDLIGASEQLWEIGGVRDVDILVAAFFHTALDGTNTTIEEISYFFGSRVANIMLELTNDSPIAPGMSREAHLIKLNDRLYSASGR